MRIYCTKHQKITQGFNNYNNDEKIIKFNCGCNISVEEASKFRIIQKTTYFLPDGREIVRKSKETSYELKGKQK